MSQKFADIFPKKSDIPAQFNIDAPIDQREYLIDGTLKIWKGNLNPVLSPVCIQDGTAMEQKVIGKTPLPKRMIWVTASGPP